MNNDDYQNLYKQVMQIWVLPEIKNRQNKNLLNKPVNLRAIQILFSIDGATKVRINDEVHGNFEAKLITPKNKGDSIYENEIESIRLKNLLEEDRNFAHITMIKAGQKWHISFSFLYETKDAKNILSIGKEFLDSGKRDIEDGLIRAAINNLGVASEQVARARLILYPIDNNYRKPKTHNTIKNAINVYSNMANLIPKAYASYHNKLIDLRDKARYDTNFAGCSKEELNKISSEIKNLYDQTLLLILKIR
jgi:uncharacterized protein (UPF0332 family)